MTAYEGTSATFVDEFDAYMLITDTIESLLEVHIAYSGIDGEKNPILVSALNLQCCLQGFSKSLVADIFLNPNSIAMRANAHMRLDLHRLAASKTQNPEI